MPMSFPLFFLPNFPWQYKKGVLLDIIVCWGDHSFGMMVPYEDTRRLLLFLRKLSSVFPTLGSFRVAGVMVTTAWTLERHR